MISREVHFSNNENELRKSNFSFVLHINLFPVAFMKSVFDNIPTYVYCVAIIVAVLLLFVLINAISPNASYLPSFFISFNSFNPSSLSKIIHTPTYPDIII